METTWGAYGPTETENQRVFYKKSTAKSAQNTPSNTKQQTTKARPVLETGRALVLKKPALQSMRGGLLVRPGRLSGRP